MALDSLLSARAWQPNELAFQGGTSLHLMRHSPRRSEDLDFLISLNDQEIDKVLRRTCRAVAGMAHLEWPSATIECSSKLPPRSRNRLAELMLKCQHPDLARKVRVKLDVMRVHSHQLSGYATEALPLRGPHRSLRVFIAPLIPTATLSSLYVDKLTAIPLRRYLKCRDLFDLWWLRTNHSRELPADRELAAALATNLSIYQAQTASWCEKADAFLVHAASDEAALLERLGDDLPRWLPSSVFQQIRDLVGLKALLRENVLALSEALAQARDLNGSLQ